MARTCAEAARAEPKLRQLCPIFRLGSDGRHYRVRKFLREGEIGEAATAREAAASAAARLPAHPGPAVVETADPAYDMWPMAGMA
ncbi:DUF6193 family natural product biosynthesis protein [Streptomyces sp. NPDC005485]|uniref:DUF6193 family natural product biosynthesis protein n=1 Tax=Streptomyces sp. NPDC005485 TaxID=3155591 RepID=UPI0033B22208